MARLAAGFLTGRISDCHPGLPAYRFRLDKIFHTTPHPARLLRNHRFCDVLHLHHRSGLIRFLGIPAGCHPDLLLLLISERCHGKRQLLVHITRNPSYADLCSHPLRYFLRRTYPGESTVEDTLSAAVCISRPFITDSCALHSYPWRFFRIDNEPEQSIL